MKYITYSEIDEAAKNAAIVIKSLGYKKCFPIPRGGVPAAFALLKYCPELEIVGSADEAQFYVDDLVDSGTTAHTYNDKPFIALFCKQSSYRIPNHVNIGSVAPDKWLVFPWEDNSVGSAEDIAVRLLQYIGEDPNREGLVETPARFLKAWGHWARGYKQNPADVLKVFEDGAEGCDEMILVNNIPVWSHCEHHIAPIIGKAWVAYIPNGKIVGLSKIPRLVDIFARRLQVQERLTNQIADALMEHLQPKGCAILIEARHLCMESRGIEKVGAATTTSALRGVFMENLATRAEFFSMVKR